MTRTDRTTTSRSFVGRTLAGLASATLALGLVGGPGGAPAQAFDETTHTVMQGSPTTMGQTNGTVWTLEIAGDRVYAGGAFTSTRPSGAGAGSSETGVGNLAAFDKTTGAPIPSFSHALTNDYTNAQGVVRASVLTPDGSQLIVGGDFNLVDGRRANYLARFDARTGDYLGQVGTSGVNGPVSALAVSPDGSTLYAGGRFTKAGTVARRYAAAISLTTRATLPWAPVVSTPTNNEALRVTALGVSSDGQRVFVGGPFQTVNGAALQGFAATNAADGSTVPGFGSGLSAPTSWATSIEVAGDQVLYGSRDDSTRWQRTEGVTSVDATSGASTWSAQCYGDTFGLQVVGDDVYVASHAHDCAAIGGHPQTWPWNYVAIHALNRSTGVARPYWVQTQGTRDDNQTLQMSRALASDGSVLVMGGGFLRVNGSAQANLTRFVPGSAAPSRAGYPTATAGPGYVDVKVKLGFDRDDLDLTYEVYRGTSTTNPVSVTTRRSVFWSDESYTVRDTGVTPGQTVSYRVKTIDPSGRVTWSVRSGSVTVGEQGA